MKYLPFLPTTLTARWLALGLLVNSVGTGLYSSVLILYFVGGVHLPSAQVGFVATVAALIGLMLVPAVGSLLDRVAAVWVGVAFLGIEAGAMIWLAFASTIPAFGAGALLAAFAAQGSKVARGVLNAYISSSEERGKVRAQLRSCANLGIALGAGVAAGAVAALPASGLRWLLLGNAVTFLLLAVVYLTKIRQVQPKIEQADEGRKRRGRGGARAWTDRRYLTVMSMNGLLGVQYAALTVGVPVLVSAKSSLPDWLVPVSLLINTGVVVLFQSQLSARVRGVASAGRHVLVAGLVLGATSASFALVQVLDEAPALIALLAIVLLHSVGEILQVSGAFDLSYDLADPRWMGSYQGVYSWTAGVGSALGPGVWSVAVTATALWAAPAVGVCFMTAGAVTWVTTRRGADGGLFAKTSQSVG